MYTVTLALEVRDGEITLAETLDQSALRSAAAPDSQRSFRCVLCGTTGQSGRMWNFERTAVFKYAVLPACGQCARAVRQQDMRVFRLDGTLRMLCERAESAAKRQTGLTALHQRLGTGPNGQVLRRLRHEAAA